MSPCGVGGWLRSYVLVTSFDPLRVYLFDNGLTRFCTEKYTVSHKTLKNRFAHLTNYSVNKHSDKFLKNEDPANDMYGSKWSLKALMRYFKQNDIDTGKVMASIKDCIIKTLIAIESDVGSLVNRYFPRRYAPPARSLYTHTCRCCYGAMPWFVHRSCH